MNFWKLFNLTEFEATGLVSRTLTMLLGDLGEREILIVRGNATSIVFDGVLLPIALNDKNPYSRDGYVVWKDESNDVWLGTEAET